MFKSLIKFFKGKNKKLEKKLANTEEYWDGAIQNLEEKQEMIDERYHEAKGIYDAKKDELNYVRRNIKEAKITLEECKERYLESKDEEDKKDAELAFNELNELEAQEEILEEGLSELEETYLYIKGIREDSHAQIEERKTNAEKNKSKVKISETIKDLTEGLDDFNVKKEQGDFEVNSEYYKNKSKMEELRSKTRKPKRSNKNFENFLNS